MPVYMNDHRNRVKKTVIRSQKEWVVFDLETKDLIQKGQSYADLEVSMLGYYSSRDKEVCVVEEDDLDDFFTVAESCDMIVSFNGKHFDNRVLQKYAPMNMDEIPHFDMLRVIQDELGHRVSLQSLAVATLGASKSGDGRDAPLLWKDGKKQELKSYTEKDVLLTKNLFIKGCKEGSLLYEDKKTKEIKTVHTSNWVKEGQRIMAGIDKVEELLKQFRWNEDHRDHVTKYLEGKL